MEAVCGGPKPYLSADALEQEHLKCRDKALEQFRLKRKMGGEEFSEAYRIRLEAVNILYVEVITFYPFLKEFSTYSYVKQLPC